MNIEVVSDNYVERVFLNVHVQLKGGRANRYDKLVNACGPWSAKPLTDSQIESKLAHFG